MIKRPIASTEIYGNWLVQQPDGEAIFRCSEKRAKWYLKRSLAVEIEPHVLRLNFIPKGRGAADDPSGYHLERKAERCVICGTDKQLTKHHIVPSVFRQHFPNEYKSRASFDIVIVCHECHDAYERVALQYHYRLRAEAHCATNSCLQLNGYEVYVAQKIRGILGALIQHSESIPEERVQHLRSKIDQHFGRAVDPKEFQQLYDQLYQISLETECYGKRVVEQQKDLFAFIVSWRKHFLDHAKPKFLSQRWIDFYDKVIK